LIETKAGACDPKGFDPQAIPNLIANHGSNYYTSGGHQLQLEFCFDVTPTTSCSLEVNIDTTRNGWNTLCFTGGCTFNGVFKVQITLCPEELKLAISVCLPGLKKLTDKLTEYGLNGLVKSLGLDGGCLLIAEGGYNWRYQRLWLGMAERCLGFTGIKGCVQASMYLRATQSWTYHDTEEWELRDWQSGRIWGDHWWHGWTGAWINFYVGARAEYPTCGWWSCWIEKRQWDFVNSYVNLG